MEPVEDNPSTSGCALYRSPPDLDFAQVHKKKHVKLTITKIREKEPLVDLKEGGEDGGG